MATRKVPNNKVEFSAHGESLVMRLSDKELFDLRCYSIHRGCKKDEWKKASSGFLYNFSAFALFDYDIKSASKRGRFHKTFNYHKFEQMYWYLMD